ncbi:hypothetical protein OG698_29685 [Streptomyces sp. NBC_01003]|uniref:hypothetical protein n=1 Tax=Streptomyces sp. NBC_01003 TaxID=2903714 RepID=UPI00386B9EA8|nr:hypothetical protein OG698_29685 [Streptomyces sp. NBC_01003]
MVEIVVALIGGAAVVGGTVITARWTRSRPTDNRAPDSSPPASNTNDGGTTNAPRSSQPDGGAANAPQPPRGARSGGVTVNGQFIETNNGTVSQNNYRDGKK